MGNIIISTNLTLDGVIQDPDGQEGFDRGGWFSHAGESDLGLWAAHVHDEALRSDALLLGRRSDAWFAARWASRTGPRAERLNAMPKYVVSSTVVGPDWSPATVLSGDVVAEVTRLRWESTGDVLIYASYVLVRTLLERDLVDEIRLIVFPVLAGAGKRLFGEITASKPLRLVGADTLGDGLVVLRYQPVGAG